MENAARARRSSGHGHPALRVAVAALLVACFALEILPFGFTDSLPAAPGGQRERTFCIEPLQLCDTGDGLVGFLFDLPALIPGMAVFLPSPVVRRLLPDAAAPVPNGFRPAIDHPPQLSA